MAQRRHHYERAFEALLRRLRVPYVAVDEAKRTLLPSRGMQTGLGSGHGSGSLKSFDFVLYSPGGNLLVDVKGRRLSSPPTGLSPARARPRRLESWVNEEDVRAMSAWGELFGPEFEPAFVFLYACDQRPDDHCFEEIFAFEDLWYAPRVVSVGEYARAMRCRSRSWGTVDLSPQTFEAICGPLLGRGFERNSLHGTRETPLGQDLGSKGLGSTGLGAGGWPQPGSLSPWIEPMVQHT